MDKENMWDIRRLSAEELEQRMRKLRKAETPKRTKMLSARFDPKDIEAWRLAAATSGLPFYVWMETVLNFATEQLFQGPVSESQPDGRLKTGD